MVVTFDRLCVLCPELTQFAREAEQAARHGWLSWPQWLRTYTEFQRLFGFEGEPELRSQEAFEALLQCLTRLHQRILEEQQDRRRARTINRKSRKR